jgi:hypothetical protein
MLFVESISTGEVTLAFFYFFAEEPLHSGKLYIFFLNFLLFERIFIDPTLRSNAIDAPSGMFPGGADGAWRFKIGGYQGPDHVFAKYFRDVVLNLKHHTIFLSL